MPRVTLRDDITLAVILEVVTAIGVTIPLESIRGHNSTIQNTSS